MYIETIRKVDVIITSSIRVVASSQCMLDDGHDKNWSFRMTIQCRAVPTGTSSYRYIALGDFDDGGPKRWTAFAIARKFLNRLFMKLIHKRSWSNWPGGALYYSFVKSQCS